MRTGEEEERPRQMAPGVMDPHSRGDRATQWMVLWPNHTSLIDQHGLLTGAMWLSDLGILFSQFQVDLFRNAFLEKQTLFFPVKINVVSSFLYELALFGHYNSLLLLVMRLSDLVAKKTEPRPHQPFLKLF